MKNTYEQSFIEKLRSLLKFGANSRRYKDIFDMYYLRIVVSENKMKELMDILIFFFAELEKSSAEQKKRIEQAREDKKTQKKEDENEASHIKSFEVEIELLSSMLLPICALIQS